VQDKLAQAVLAATAAAGVPMAVVLIHGGALSIEAIKKGADTILDAHYPGAATGAAAIADTLYGRNNPGGKLTYSVMPAAFGNLSNFASMSMTAPPGRTYKYFPTSSAMPPPLWPFGWGLSYTTFNVSCSVDPTQKSVGCTVHNTGKRDGAEVLQLFHVPPATAKAKTGALVPRRRLIDFQKLSVFAGGSAKHSFSVTATQLQLATETGGRVIVAGEGGSHQLLVSTDGGGSGVKLTIKIKPSDKSSGDRATITKMKLDDAAAGGASPAPAPGAWLPRDAAGVVRYSALGIFPLSNGGNGFVTAQATVKKSSFNPLFIQDKPWEVPAAGQRFPRIEYAESLPSCEFLKEIPTVNPAVNPSLSVTSNGYPNVVYDAASGAKGDGPWRCWYGGIGSGGQYLYYANSSNGLKWTKPILNRYDLGHRWPSLKRIGKKNNIVMFGGGLGMYKDEHEQDPALRYKISGGSPAPCFSADGNEGCLHGGGVAGSSDGISSWTAVKALSFAKPWRPDCHTNMFYDDPTSQYIMTTRDYSKPDGRLISIARSGGKGSFNRTGGYTLLMSNSFPPAVAVGEVTVSKTNAVVECAAKCAASAACAFLWVYTSGKDGGKCFMKSALLPGPPVKPACKKCSGGFYKMNGTAGAAVNGSSFVWGKQPVIVDRGVAVRLTATLSTCRDLMRLL